MAIKSNIALSYIAMLSVVGFFLWIIRGFVRGLHQKAQLPAVFPSTGPLTDAAKRSVDWPVHIFLHRQDDIPTPGRMVAISPAYAFMESSACLKTGQEVSLYVDIAGQDQVRLATKVIWAREGRDGRNAAQLIFPGLSADKKKELFRMAIDL